MVVSGYRGTELTSSSSSSSDVKHCLPAANGSPLMVSWDIWPWRTQENSNIFKGRLQPQVKDQLNYTHTQALGVEGGVERERKREILWKHLIFWVCHVLGDKDTFNNPHDWAICTKTTRKQKANLLPKFWGFPISSVCVYQSGCASGNKQVSVWA